LDGAAARQSQPGLRGRRHQILQRFALIASAMDNLWDEQDEFFYDRLRTKDGSSITVRARSMVGLLPVFAAVEPDASLWQRLPMFRERALWYLEHKLRTKNHLYYLPSSGRPRLISLVEKSRFQRILARTLDETEFLSPYGLRSLSRYHQEHPLVLDFDGRTCRLDYEPGESHSGLFGGNSNWRGPVWFPLNFLAIESLRHLHNFLGEDLTVELPTGSASGRILTKWLQSSGAVCSACFCSTRMAGGRRTAQIPTSKTIQPREIRSSSMSTSMPRRQRVLARRIRPDGRPLPRRSWRTERVSAGPKSQS
jgi:hypothetical protein